MEKKELIDIIEKVRLAYPQASREYTVVQMAELYKTHLLKEDYEKVLDNLNSHIEKSKFPPAIADLIPPKKIYKTPEETSRSLDALENKKPLSKEELAEWHKKVLDAIGVKRC